MEINVDRSPTAQPRNRSHSQPTSPSYMQQSAAAASILESPSSISAWAGTGVCRHFCLGTYCTRKPYRSYRGSIDTLLLYGARLDLPLLSSSALPNPLTKCIWYAMRAGQQRLRIQGCTNPTAVRPRQSPHRKQHMYVPVRTYGSRYLCSVRDRGRT